MAHSPLKAALPTLATSGNLVLGLVSVALSASGHFEGAAWCVVYSAILDKVDGSLARALGVSGQFGMEMDSFADFSGFGMAPGFLCWFYCAPPGSPGWLMAWVGACAVLLPLLAAIRLAKFNSVTHEDPGFFQGVPTTLIGGLFATLFLSLLDLQVPRSAVAWVMPSAAVVGGLLMICTVRIPKMKRQATRWANVGQWGAIGALTVLAIAQELPEAHFVLGTIFVVYGAIRYGRGGGEATPPGGAA